MICDPKKVDFLCVNHSRKLGLHGTQKCQAMQFLYLTIYHPLIYIAQM